MTTQPRDAHEASARNKPSLGPDSMIAGVGVVVIGRNEGERLRASLHSIVGRAAPVVYVDSGSADGSADLAAHLGADVVRLAPPFSAARARNEGWRRLAAIAPETEFIQLVDGDCILDAGWIPTARDHLATHPRDAVACGRVRERDREASVYNRLCDVEWDAPPGPSKACGGNAMMRLAALREVNGFDESLIAGEEPELCFRLRERDWNIERLPAEMVLHDAAMHSIRQWWRRSRRSGYAYAHVNALHGSSPERMYRREVRSLLFWGFGLPVLVLGASLLDARASLLLLLYPLQVLRLRLRLRSGRVGASDRTPYAVHCVASKVPEFLGWLGHQGNRIRSRRGSLIEHK